MNRPDFSEYVAHFTKDSEPFNTKAIEDGRVKKSAGLSAIEKLKSILNSGEIWATPMPWTNKDAVAFTECPWSSLLDHAANYSPYGVGFAKPRIYAAGGGPALYVRPDHYKKQEQFRSASGTLKGFHPHVHAFVTPFLPPYAPASKRGGLKGSLIDFTHEREWRIPHSFKFDLKQVSFVVLNTHEDMASFPKSLKDTIGHEKFILMENYKHVERLWPTHLMPEPASKKGSK